MYPARFAPFAALALAVLVGHVTDKTTGQPLPGLDVQVGGAHPLHARTAADGSYRVAGLKPGRYDVTISSDDVPPRSSQVTIGNEKQHTLDVVACSVTLDYSCGQP
jgi:TonB-dependent starch-binding outer membrane protein SusC